jgi:hypothetical protein
MEYLHAGLLHSGPSCDPQYFLYLVVVQLSVAKLQLQWLPFYTSHKDTPSLFFLGLAISFLK